MSSEGVTRNRRGFKGEFTTLTQVGGGGDNSKFLDTSIYDIDISLSFTDRRESLMIKVPNLPNNRHNTWYYLNIADCFMYQLWPDTTLFLLLISNTWQWEREHSLFHKMITVPMVARYRKWKSFTIWRKNVRSHTMVGGCSSFKIVIIQMIWCVSNYPVISTP